MNLYTIQEKYLYLFNKAQDIALDENSTPEQLEELEKELNINHEELKDKALAYTMVIKNTDSDITAIDNEIKRLQGIKKTKVNLQVRLKTKLSEALKLYDIKELDLTIFKLSFRKTPASVNDEKFKNYWQEQANEISDQIKTLLIDSSFKFLDSTNKVKELFNIEIVIKPNKKALKDEIISNKGEESFLSFLESGENLSIK